MGRARVELSQEVLVNTINDAEAEESFSSRSALFSYVADVLEVPPYIVANRVREWGIALKTPLGKRGRPPGSGNSNPTSTACHRSVAIAPIGEAPDFSDLLAAFRGAGIDVKSSIDLIAHQNRPIKENRKIRQAWDTLRDILDAPYGWVDPATKPSYIEGSNNPVNQEN